MLQASAVVPVRLIRVVEDDIERCHTVPLVAAGERLLQRTLTIGKRVCEAMDGAALGYRQCAWGRPS